MAYPFNQLPDHVDAGSGKYAKLVQLSGSMIENDALKVKIAGTDDTGTGSLGVTIKGSDIMQAQDLQYRRSETIQTHNAVSVGASSSSNGSYVDCDGFTDLAVTLMNDAATGSHVDIHWSHDGTTQHGGDYNVVATGTTQRKAGSTSVKARYARVVVANDDAAAHTMSAWVYLKV